MKVRDVMTTNVLTIDEFTTVGSAINIMQDNGLSSLIIEPLDKKDSYGIITEIDILYKVIAPGHNPEDLCVRDIMTKPCIEIKPNLDIQSVAQLFAKTGICSAPIVQKKIFSPKKLLGIVSVSDLIPKSDFIRQPSDTRELSKVDDKLTDYQRLRSEGAISRYSTRILDKMPPEQSHPSPSDSLPQPEEKDESSKETTQDSTPQKSSRPDKDQLTDYQRLRSQGAISRYSTRIIDKMPPEPSHHSSSDSVAQPEQRDNSLETTTQDSTPQKSSRPDKDQLTDYQRLRSEGAISRYSTRILDKMTPEQSHPSPSDSLPQPEEKDESSKKTTQDSTAEKSSRPDKDQLTDYQRLRSQGAISRYSTRILDKMPPEQSHPSSGDSLLQPEEKNESSKKTTQDTSSEKSSRPDEDQLTDYQRLRFQGAISRYSTRILDKMPPEQSHPSPSDSLPQPEEKDESSKKTTQDSTAEKSSRSDKDQLTDYQRLRSQGAISRYSTRIIDKMPEKPKDD